MSLGNSLVIGGFGFLGSAISNNLIRLGSNVTIIDNLETGNRKLINDENYNFLNTDVCSENWQEQLKKSEFDYIFNFGSYSSDRVYNLGGEAVFRTIKGMFNVVKFAEATGVKSVIYPSSGTVYGNSIPPQSENNSILKPKTMYACTKLFLENFTQTLNGSTNYGALRIFTGYGEGEIFKGNLASVVTLFYKAMTQSKKPVIYGNGEQKRDFIYSDDIAKIAIKLAENGFNGSINVGTGVSTSFNQLIESFNDLLGIQVKPEYINSPIPWVDETRADLTKLKAVTGYKPKGIKEGITSFINEIAKYKDLE
jgi:nucleoside-diphosphate-sugar epimerase